MGERIFQQSVADLIYPEMRALVRAHQRRGHTVVFSSSALTMQAEPVARYLGIDHVVCNRFVVDELGILTGDIERRDGPVDERQRQAKARRCATRSPPAPIAELTVMTTGAAAPAAVATCRHRRIWASRSASCSLSRSAG
jgi:hypothetical protein